jgi:uncharacterized repeat protein (TIGR03833 family)
MNGQRREDIYPGLEVDIVLKKDQRTQPSRKATAGKPEKLTRGIVQDILTSAPFHSRGIKVRLTTGEVGRVARILSE